MGARGRRQQAATIQKAGTSAASDLTVWNNRIRRETAAPIILILFGGYLSILYFGHQAVPNSDFTSFVRTGEEILHFQIPHSFKRLPGLGILQIGLGLLMPGPFPILTGGLLLNALLYPFCGLLLYRIGARFLGRGAFWIALTAMVNPWVLSWLVHPIAEIPLIFFILLTFFLLFEKGRWAWPAALAASMIRYEGAILILLVFFADLYRSRNWRQRLTAAGLAFFCSLPIVLWVLGQILTHEAAGANDYLSSYKAAAGGKPMVFGEFAGHIRQVSVGAYLEIPGLALNTAAARISGGLLAVGLAAAVGLAVYHKRADVIGLAVFAAVYFLLHGSRTGTRSRYAAPAAWIVLLIWLYGLSGLWNLLRSRFRIPGLAIFCAQVILCIVSIGLAVSLIPRTADLHKISPVSKSVPLVALVCGLLWGLIQTIGNRRQITWQLTAFCATAFALTANQITLIPSMGSGAIDQEFKELAIWYQKNAKPGERMASTLPNILALFAPEKQSRFVHIQWIQGDSAEDFIPDCYKQNITYLAWDSRLGFAIQNAYYKIYKLDRISFLGPRIGPNNQLILPPKKNGPFELIGTIENSRYPSRFILIYRLSPLPAAETKNKPFN